MGPRARGARWTWVQRRHPRGSEPWYTPTCAWAGDAQRPTARPRLCPAEAQWRPAAAGGQTSAAPPPTAPPPSAPRTWPQRLGDSENQQEEQQEDTAVCLGHHLSSVHRPRGSRVTPRGGQTWPRAEGEGRTPAWGRVAAGEGSSWAAARECHRLARTVGHRSGMRFRLAQDGGRPAPARATPPPARTNQ